MTVETWSALVGFFVPALVAVVNREDWKPWLKAVVALVASILVGTITALVAGHFNGTNWVAAMGVVFAASQAAYHAWWKNSDITGWIEQRVNVISGTVLPSSVTTSGEDGSSSGPTDTGW